MKEILLIHSQQGNRNNFVILIMKFPASVAFLCTLGRNLNPCHVFS